MIYLDHNATTPLNPQVKNVILNNLDAYNPSSIYKAGREAKALINKGRQTILESLNLNSNYKLIFTSSGTEANNTVIANFINENILVSSIEHLSVIEPAKKAAHHESIKVDKNGLIDLEDLEKKLQNLDAITLVSVMLANNETGIIQPMEEIVKLSRKYKALIHSDISQTYGKLDADYNKLDLDFITLSAHKAGGPIGVGAVIYKEGFDIKPLIAGGGQERGLRGGTENVALILGFAKLAEIIKTNGPNLFARSFKQKEMIESQIMGICPELTIFSKHAERLDNTSMFTMPGVKSEVQIINFDLEGICVSSGSACSSGKITNSYVLKAMGVEEEEASCAIRVSLGPAQADTDISLFIKKWQEIYERLRG